MNTVESHSRCNAAYCLRRKNSQTQAKCRFDYPRPTTEATDIVFETLPSGRIRAKLITKRNDPLINTHNPTLLQHWRANVDLPVIIDIEDCVAKAETKSQKKKLQTCQQTVTDITSKECNLFSIDQINR